MPDFLQNIPKLAPKLDRVLPQINIPPPNEAFNSNKKTILIISIAIVVVALIILSAVLLLSGEKKEISPAIRPTPVTTQTPRPTQTQSYTPLSQTPPPSSTSLTPCGNGKIDAGEGCDGVSFGNQTCVSIRGENYGGALSCTSTCKIDSSSCTIKRIISVRDSTSFPPLTQTSGSAPAPNAVKVNDAVKLSNSVKIT